MHLNYSRRQRDTVGSYSPARPWLEKIRSLLILTLARSGVAVSSSSEGHGLLYPTTNFTAICPRDDLPPSTHPLISCSSSWDYAFVGSCTCIVLLVLLLYIVYHLSAPRCQLHQNSYSPGRGINQGPFSTGRGRISWWIRSCPTTIAGALIRSMSGGFEVHIKAALSVFYHTKAVEEVDGAGREMAISCCVSDNMLTANQLSENTPLVSQVSDNVPPACNVSYSTKFASNVSDNTPLACNMSASIPLARQVSDNTASATPLSDNAPLAGRVSERTTAGYQMHDNAELGSHVDGSVASAGRSSGNTPSTGCISDNTGLASHLAYNTPPPSHVSYNIASAGQFSDNTASAGQMFENIPSAVQVSDSSAAPINAISSTPSASHTPDISQSAGPGDPPHPTVITGHGLCRSAPRGVPQEMPLNGASYGGPQEEGSTGIPEEEVSNGGPQEQGSDCIPQEEGSNGGLQGEGTDGSPQEGGSSGSNKEVFSEGLLDDGCVVCLDSFKDGGALRRLGCGHSFHKVCIHIWIIRNPTCPTCRCSVFDSAMGSKQPSPLMSLSADVPRLHRRSLQTPGRQSISSALRPLQAPRNLYSARAAPAAGVHRGMISTLASRSQRGPSRGSVEPSNRSFGEVRRTLEARYGQNLETMTQRLHDLLFPQGLGPSAQFWGARIRLGAFDWQGPASATALERQLNSGGTGGGAG